MTSFSDYKSKKQFFDTMLTIYGRKSVLEALQSQLPIYRIHFSQNNKPAKILQSIENEAKKQAIDIVYHTPKALSRISKNGKQDQGVAADIQCDLHQNFSQWLNHTEINKQRLLALDGIHNPQNLGMIIRSACAAGIDAILLSNQGTAKIGPLVIKASSGTVFKAPLVFCENLAHDLPQLQQKACSIITLRADAKQSIFEHQPSAAACYILGNETHGVSDAVDQLADEALSIPLSNQVESLNVAVSAALISYLSYFQSK